MRLTRAGSLPKVRVLVMGLRKFVSMSMMGANAQLAPTAAASRAQASAILVAICTSSVAAISMGEPTSVPSATIPLPPFSRFAAIRRGTLLRTRSAWVAATARAVDTTRYMQPPGDRMPYT